MSAQHAQGEFRPSIADREDSCSVILACVDLLDKFLADDEGRDALPSDMKNGFVRSALHSASRLAANNLLNGGVA